MFVLTCEGKNRATTGMTLKSLSSFEMWLNRRATLQVKCALLSSTLKVVVILQNGAFGKFYKKIILKNWHNYN